MTIEEYAQRFVGNGSTPKALARIILQMLSEAGRLGHQRGARSDEEMFTILDEMDQKFMALVKQVGGKFSDGSLIHPEGFRRILRSQMHDIFDAWNASRGGQLITT